MMTLAMEQETGEHAILYAETPSRQREVLTIAYPALSHHCPNCMATAPHHLDGCPREGIR